MDRDGKRSWRDLGGGKNMIKIYLNLKIVLNNENIIKCKKLVIKSHLLLLF